MRRRKRCDRRRRRRYCGQRRFGGLARLVHVNQWGVRRSVVVHHCSCHHLSRLPVGRIGCVLSCKASKHVFVRRHAGMPVWRNALSRQQGLGRSSWSRSVPPSLKVRGRQRSARERWLEILSGRPQLGSLGHLNGLRIRELLGAQGVLGPLQHLLTLHAELSLHVSRRGLSCLLRGLATRARHLRGRLLRLGPIGRPLGPPWPRPL